MKQEELKTLLRKKFISRRYVADATGMSLPAVHLFVNGEADRKLSAKNWEKFQTAMKVDKIKVTLE